jgi:hypothetical protein
MDAEASILVRPKLVAILANIAQSISTSPEDIGLDVMIQVVDVEKAIVMDK